MGTFSHPITLIGPTGGPLETLDALVDTGATFSSIPGTVLERLGVSAEWQVRLGLADGSIVQRDMGRVDAEIDGERRPVICVFSPDDAPVLIGAHTLEAFLLMGGPAEQRLVLKDALWL